MKAIEIKGKINEQGNLLLDPELSLRNQNVRVIILSEEEEEKH